MERCIFCKIISKEIPSDILYEDSRFLVFLDINPVNKGHSLVVPKEHHENIYDIPDELFKELAIMTKKTAIAVKKGVHADGINIGMNNERAAGQLVDHVHVHVIPRFNNDGYKHWHREERLSADDMADAKKSIKTEYSKLH